MESKVLIATTLLFFLLAHLLGTNESQVNYPYQNTKTISSLGGGVDVGDSLALVALYNATGGDDWLNNENWLEGEVKDWFGITVEECRVTQITLTLNNLVGEIPNEIGNLSNISLLNLQANQLSIIPPKIGDLTNLSVLRLNSNQLSELPPEIGDLTNLSVLYLNSNQLSELPPKIGDLTNLSDLNLDNNQLSQIPSEMGSLNNLSKLNLRNNQINEIPTEIGNLNNLLELDLIGNKLSEIPPEVGILHNLSELYLSGNQLIILPPEIGNLNSLSVLDLFLNRLIEIPPEIGNLSNLSELFVSNNHLSEIPSEIENLNNLSKLYVYNNQLSQLPSEIGNLSNLSELFVSNNHLSEIPSEIENLNNLSKLYVYNNQLSQLPSEIGNLSNLSELFVSNNHLSEIPSEIGNLNNLSKLYLYNNQLSQLPSEIGSLNNLSELYLYNNQLSQLPSEIGSLNNLSKLYLSNNHLSEIPPEIGNLNNLERLFLCNNKLVQIPPEIGNLNNLEWLFLCNNKLVQIPPEIGNLNNLSWLGLNNNQLNQIPPEIGNLTNLSQLYLQNNQLDFLSLEILLSSLPISVFNYAPQTKIRSQQVGTLQLNVPFKMMVSAGGMNTQYQWYKDEVLLPNQTDSVLLISSPEIEDAGIYVCDASNSDFPDLILESHPSYLVLPNKEFIISPIGGGNYTSLQDAFADLENGNIELINNQSIVFNLAPDSAPYEEALVIPEIIGTNEATHIIINGNNNTLIVEGKNCESPAIIQNKGTDYLIINDLNIVIPETADAGWGIHLKNGADHIQINNCHIQLPSTATTTCFAGIVASNSDTTYLDNDVAMGINAHNTLIQNCHIVGGYTGIAVIGSADTTMFGPTIVNNILEDVYHTGILSTFSNGSITLNNQIDMTNYDENEMEAPSSEDAIGLSYKCMSVQLDNYFKKPIDESEAKQGRALTIQNNQLKGIQHRGISLIDCYSRRDFPLERPQPPLSVVANNLIEGQFQNNELSSGGIYLEKVRTLNFYHNSVEMGGSGQKAAMYIQESRDLAILNNSLALMGKNGYGLYVADNSPISLDYNNYYATNSPFLTHVNGNDYSTVAEMPGNIHSISAEPTFVFTFDSDSELLEAASEGVANLVPTDFEGDIRPDPFTLKPDIGANEFVIGIFDSTFNKIANISSIKYTLPDRWEHSILKNDSIVFSIKSNVILGNIVTDLYIHNQEDIRQIGGKHYLDRNFRLELKKNFSPNDTIELYLYTNQRELNGLIAVDEQVQSFKDLNLTFVANDNEEEDISTFSGNGETKLFRQTNGIQITQSIYLLAFTLTDITQLGEFWLHGGEEALVVGIEEAVATFEGLSVYPNPSYERFSVEFDSPTNNNLTMTRVWDLQGNLIHQHQFNAVVGRNRYELEALESLASGVYLVEVRQGEKRGVRKVLKR